MSEAEPDALKALGDLVQFPSCLFVQGFLKDAVFCGRSALADAKSAWRSVFLGSEGRLYSDLLSADVPENLPRASSPQAIPNRTAWPEPVSLLSVAKPASTLPEPVPFQALDLPKPERVAKLQMLQQEVAKCRRCHELAHTRTQTVFGVGNPEAKILFIGEAPGADEDKQGVPFVGRAGQLLNVLIKACHLQREDIYICNVLRCRPPGNRLPSPDEAGNCREYLDGQIAIVNPDYIVCWGSCAAQNLLGTTMPIGRLRGQFFRYGRAKVLCTFHPSYLLRNPAAKKDVWSDMKFLFRDQGIKL